MKCPKCHYEVPEDSNFCNKCAHPLQAQEQAPPIDFTRPHSYTPKFLADKILTTRSAMEGERKRVTVLFADVAGFISMSEKLDPEEVHQIIDGCFKILMDEIHTHQGTINQFTGDGVMALFGAPLAIENHTQNACQAALAIQAAMKKYSKELATKFGLDFKMRIGLNTGPVIVGSIGDDLRMDYTAIGDTVNLASRMESMAEPGTILVSDITYKRVSQFFKFEPLGKVTVKGKEDPLDAYKLAGKIERPASGLERQIFSEMVGRDDDLNKLELQVNKAASGEGSIVNVIGEAGIGKSRLIAELRNSSVMKRVTLLEGRAISIGRNLSFHPIINLLKHWAKIEDKDTSVSALGKLETAIRSICPEDTNEIFPFVATLMGMKLSGRHLERVNGIEGEALEKLIFKNMRDLLIKTTEQTPLVVVIEDLHWADTSSIELMESLFRLAETQRIVFINVFRPNHPETGDRIIETIKEKLPVYYVEIHLQPLNEQMGETLINNMLKIKGLQQAVVNQIIQRAGGNPFFIEEVVRSFIDEGAVVKANGEFKVTEKIEKMVIPHTINDVLMARIDRLDENTRDLVKVASVIGRSFFYRILTQVASTVDGIDNRLSYLKQIELIREQRRMEELEYLFKHALAQEAAYDSILHQKRKDLHLQVARSIEKVFKERLYEFYGMLAYHYSRGENEEKAEGYLIKAGEETLKSSASNEALYYYRKAINLYLTKYGDSADPFKVAEIEKNIAVAHFEKGQYENAAKYFDRVLNHLKVGSPKSKIIFGMRFITDLLITIVNLYFQPKTLNKIPEKRDNEIFDIKFRRILSLAYFNPKRMLAEAMNLNKEINRYDLKKLKNGILMYLFISGVFSFSSISYSISRRILNYCSANIESDKEQITYRLWDMINNFSFGKWTTIQKYDAELLDVALKSGDLWTVVTCLLYYILFNIEIGEYETAKILTDKISDIGKEYEYDTAIAYQYWLKIKLMTKSRQLNALITHVDEALEFHSKIGMEGPVIFFLGSKAIIQVLMNDIDGAKKTIKQSAKIVYKLKPVPPHYLHTHLMAMFLLYLALYEDSISSGNILKIYRFRRMAYKTGKTALQNSNKYVSDRTEVLKLIGSYYWIAGRQKKALKWWDRAIKKGEELGARPDLSRTYFQIGKRLLEPNSKYKDLNGITAEEYLEKARTLFEEMDLQWDLDELDKVMAAK